MSVGEDLLERYLGSLNLSFEREPLIGGRRPDFLVDFDGQPVACEVYEPENRLPHLENPGDTSAATGGFIDSYSSLRKGFDSRKQDQIKAFSKAGLPVVLVLAETSSDIPIDPVIMAGAMYGNVQVTFSVGPEASETPETTMGFGAGGRVQPERRTGLSAVAVIKEFNPGEWHVEEAIDGRLREMGLSRARQPTQAQLAEALNVIVAAYNEAEEVGTFDRTLRAVRLEMIHNPFAVRPLGLDLLCGPYDRQWARLDGVSGPGHVLVSEGYLAYRIAGRQQLLAS